MRNFAQAQGVGDPRGFSSAGAGRIVLAARRARGIL